MIITAWLYGLIWSVLPFFGRHQYVLEGFKTSCSFDYIDQDYYTRVILILMNIFGFFIPILSILICYSFILIHFKTRYSFIKIKFLSSSRIKFTKGPRPNVLFSNTISQPSCEISREKIDCEEAQMRPRLNSCGIMTKHITRRRANSYLALEWQITKNTIIIIFAFCIAWLPYALISLVAQFSVNRDKFITPHTSLIPVIMAKLSAVLNPIIYVFNSRNFKASIFQYISKSWKRVR
jgi:hypothetical protein